MSVRRLNMLTVVALLVVSMSGCSVSGSDDVEAPPVPLDNHGGADAFARAPAGPPRPVSHIESAIRSDIRFREAMVDFRACMREHDVRYTITDHPESLWSALAAFEPSPGAPEVAHARFESERSRVLRAHHECEPPLREVENVVQQDYLADYQRSWDMLDIPAR